MSTNGKLFPQAKKKIDMAQARAIVKLKREVNAIKKRDKVESHYCDVVQSLTPGNAATLLHLTPIAQGDGEGDRNGTEVALRSVHYRCTVIPNSSANGDAGRFILFRWKSACSGAPPSVGSILTSTTNIDSPYNPDFKDSLVVVKDTKIYVSPGSGATGLNINAYLHNSYASYVNTTGAGYNEGQLFAIILFAENVNKSTFSYFSRVRFAP